MSTWISLKFCLASAQPCELSTGTWVTVPAACLARTELEYSHTLCEWYAINQRPSELQVCCKDAMGYPKLVCWAALSPVKLAAGSRLSLSFPRASCHMPLADQVAGLFLEQGLGTSRMRRSRALLLLLPRQYRSCDLLFRFLPEPGGFESWLDKLLLLPLSW